MSFYLSNAFGFFLQLAPCVLMVFLPFSQESYPVSRRAVLLGALSACGGLALVFPLLISAFGSHLTGDIVILIASAITLAAAILLIQEPPTKKVLVFFMVLFYAISQFWMVNSVLPLIPASIQGSNPIYYPYGPLTALLYAAAAALSLPLMLRYVVFPMERYLQEMEPGKTRREISAAIFSTIVLVAAMMYVYNFGYYLDTTYRAIVSALELLLILEQILIYWLVFQESMSRKRESERQQALEIQKLQYEKIRHEMENTRRFRHDLRHHLNTLGVLNAQGRQDEISAYLKQYGAVADRLESIRYSGDPVVDGVLEYYLTQAHDLDIPTSCEVTLHADSGIEATDMTVLLGNLLENALNALEQVPPPRRSLSVELQAAKSSILLRIRNACAQQDSSGEPAGWALFARDSSLQRTGVGLSSVSTIAEKYHGSALFQRKDGEFIARVILNPKQTAD